jgi:purine nucleosidase
LRKIIFDCDNTFGLENHDVDDGLTLFYLLGAAEMDLLGVTLTYGNGTLEEVVQMTKALQGKVGIHFNYYSKNQADFLVEMVNKYPHEVTILATGALTNILEASMIDPGFFVKVQEIVLMGGTTEPLVVNQRPVSELNFSCDASASKKVLLSRAKITIMNGHMTAQAFFSKKDLSKFIKAAESQIEQGALEWISETLEKWINWNEQTFGFSGFCNWDMTTAVYLECPELFSHEKYCLSATQPDLTIGRISLAEQSYYIVKMPKRILDLTEFNHIVIQRMLAGLLK